MSYRFRTCQMFGLGWYFGRLSEHHLDTEVRMFECLVSNLLTPALNALRGQEPVFIKSKHKWSKVARLGELHHPKTIITQKLGDFLHRSLRGCVQSSDMPCLYDYNSEKTSPTGGPVSIHWSLPISTVRERLFVLVAHQQAAVF